MKSLTIFLVVLLSITGLKGWPAVETGLSGGADEHLDRRQTCKACNALVSFVDRIASNDTNLLENSLINMCNDYSSLPGRQTKQMCNYMTKDVLDLFKKTNKQTFCREINACQGFTGPLEPTVSDDPTCNFCVNVVTNVKDIISGGPTELEVKYFVEDACHYLGSFENECVSLSDEYIDNLFKFIRQSLQPKQFCRSIGACNTSSVSSEPNQLTKVADISEIINIFPPQTPLQPLKPAESVQTLPKDLECDICKRVVEMIMNQLKDNRTEEAIIQALENVCSLFPQKTRQKCDAFIEQYANELIHILIEEGDPGLACALLGVCVPNSVYKTINREIEREDTRSGSVKWTEIESPIEVESSDSERVMSSVDKKDNKICYECELLMHFIQNEIYDYNNEEQIEEFIEHQLCDRMTIVVTKETCDSFVQNYGPQIMQLIAQKVFDPSNVCHKELKLCDNSTNTATPTQDFQMSGSNEKCDLCISLVQQIDSLLENEQFDKEVAKMVEKTCNTLPKARRVECELMIEAFAPYFLQAIGHMTDANQVCKSIDMCYSSGSVQLLGGHKCSYGPTYWCHTIAHAEACKATHFCKNKVWKAIP